MNTERDPLGLSGLLIADKYRMDRAVGTGGFSVVYKAEHTIWKQPVAIKCFNILANAPPDQRDALLDGFIQEGKLMANLSSRSASIVQARDVGTFTTPDGLWLPYMVLEWLDGKPLDIVLYEEQAAGLPPRSIHEIMALLEPAAAALEIVHGQGIAHRDIKPANIFVIGDPRGLGAFVKVLDFGIAKVMAEHAAHAAALAHTGKDITAFTPNYGAPEQFTRSAGATGPWTDVFAMALILVEMLRGGIQALDGQDFMQLAIASRDPHTRPTPRTFGVPVSDAVEAVFACALAVRPADRFPTMGRFWEALYQAVFPDGSMWSPGTSSGLGPGPQSMITGGTGPRVARPHLQMSSQASQASASLRQPQGPFAPPSAGPYGGAPGFTQPQGAAPGFAPQGAGPYSAPGFAPQGAGPYSPPGSAPSVPSSVLGPALSAAQPSRGSPVGLIVGLLVGLAALGGGGVAAYRMFAGAPPPAPVDGRPAALAGGSGAPSSAAPTASPSAASPVVAPRTTCPDGTVLVPGGKFFMGSDDASFALWQPAHKVLLDTFCIDVNEVTAAEFKACSDVGECKRPDEVPTYPKSDETSEADDAKNKAAYAELCNFGKPGRERHPVNCVSWPLADSYCKWQKKHLPTEAEWEYAARGSDGRKFPWGDDPGSAGHMNACGLECNRWELAHGLKQSKRMYEADDGFPGTAPVGSFEKGKTKFGANDFVGNVWEWTADWYEIYKPGDAVNPKGAAAGDRKAIRGGGFNGGVQLWLNPAFRYHQLAAASSHAIGFRCAATL